MRTRPTILYFSPDAGSVPSLIRQWAESSAYPVVVLDDPADVEAIILRGAPCLLFIDADRMADKGLEMVRRLKADAFTAIVPVTMLSQAHHPERVEAWFAAGTDEVLTEIFTPANSPRRSRTVKVVHRRLTPTRSCPLVTRIVSSCGWLSTTWEAVRA